MFMLPLVPPAALYRDPAMKNPNNDKNTKNNPDHGLD
jgi:hypothetical protein